jgi:hypothetical protein
MSELPFRQVHLDFHTSEQIAGVGSRFDKQQFQEMLQLGHVDSINLFSKCHHGMSYHDTSVGVRHPGTEEELLPRQMEACHEIGVKTPIYISGGLDEAAFSVHPEWGVRTKSGHTIDPFVPGFKLLCFNTPYLDYLCAQIAEVIERFEGGDGLWIDIIIVTPCYCNWCLRGMQEHGLSRFNDEDVVAYSQIVLQKYYQRVDEIIRGHKPGLRVFHNSGHIPKGAQHIIKWNTHLELESLPTGGWGYDHFPVSAKYVATTGLDFLGMTGKFHTTWGEFGGYKRKTALQYECAAMLAFGSKCCVGDQLHPAGLMNRATYELIGAAYSEVEAKEPWCRVAQPLSEIALISPEALYAGRPRNAREPVFSEEGAARMLLELHQQFDVVDLDRDLSRYKLVVLPDDITLEGTFADRIRHYFQNGGRLLLSGQSGLNDARDTFALDLGLEVVGKSEFNPDYIVPGAELPSSPVRDPFVIHGGAWNVRILDDKIKVLAERVNTYFNRTAEHFCSHQHSPEAERSEFPAIVGNQRFVYFAHNIFERYRNYGQPLYRDLIQDAIGLLIDRPSVQTNLPTAARVSLMQQESENRIVLHLLHAVPVKRGADSSDIETGLQAVEVIEDIVPLYDIECRVRVPQKITDVRLVPADDAIDYTMDGDCVCFTVPKLFCHQMVELKLQD